MKFSDLKFHTHPSHSAGVQATLFFPNGYGASVIRTPYSYGGEDGLWELAVLVGVKGGWEISYSTPITGDVEGYLTKRDVTRLLKKIEALPQAGPSEIQAERDARTETKRKAMEYFVAYKAEDTK